LLKLLLEGVEVAYPATRFRLLLRNPTYIPIYMAKILMINKFSRPPFTGRICIAIFSETSGPNDTEYGKTDVYRRISAFLDFVLHFR